MSTKRSPSMHHCAQAKRKFLRTIRGETSCCSATTSQDQCTRANKALLKISLIDGSFIRGETSCWLLCIGPGLWGPYGLKIYKIL